MSKFNLRRLIEIAKPLTPEQKAEYKKRKEEGRKRFLEWKNKRNQAKICPKCGARMKYDEGIVYTSIPPMFGYKCPTCGDYEYDYRPRLGEEQL